MVASFVRNAFLCAGPLQEDNKRDKINKWINQRRRYFMKSLVGRHVVAAGRHIRNAHVAIILLDPMPSSWFTQYRLIFCNNWVGIHNQGWAAIIEQSQLSVNEKNARPIAWNGDRICCVKQTACVYVGDITVRRH